MSKVQGLEFGVDGLKLRFMV